MRDSYFEFKDDRTADEWINDNYKEFVVSIQKDSNVNGTLGNALFCYTGSMSKSYNNILRFNEGNISGIEDIVDKYYKIDNNDYFASSFNRYFNSETKNDIKQIYNAFSLNVINDNILLFHYFNMRLLDKDLLKKSDFKINNFISTTMVRKSHGIIKLIHTNDYDSLLVIKVKKGIQCIPIGNNPNSVLKEHEIILKPKTRFKVENIKRKWFDKIKYVIECEII